MLNFIKELLGLQKKNVKAKEITFTERRKERRDVAWDRRKRRTV